MSKLQKIKTQKEKLLKQLDILNAKEKNCLSRKFIKCRYCKKKTMVSKLIYLQHHHYVEPSGCTGGDYWSQSEGGFICIKCNKYNRSFHVPEMEGMKYHFKKQCDVYDEWGFPRSFTTYNDKKILYKYSGEVVDNWKEILK